MVRLHLPQRPRPGLTLTEALVATVILAVVGVPLFGLVVSERNTAVRAHLIYQAVLAAREEAYDLRFLRAAGLGAAELAHDFRPLSGDALARLAPVFTGERPSMPYDPAQERIETRVTFGGASGRLGPGAIAVRYGRTEGSDLSVAVPFGSMAPLPVQCP